MYKRIMILMLAMLVAGPGSAETSIQFDSIAREEERIILTGVAGYDKVSIFGILRTKRSYTTVGSYRIESDFFDINEYPLSEGPPAARLDVQNDTDCIMYFSGFFYIDDTPVQTIVWDEGIPVPPNSSVRREHVLTGPSKIAAMRKHGEWLDTYNISYTFKPSGWFSDCSSE